MRLTSHATPCISIHSFIGLFVSSFTHFALFLMPWIFPPIVYFHPRISESTDYISVRLLRAAKIKMGNRIRFAAEMYSVGTNFPFNNRSIRV